MIRLRPRTCVASYPDLATLTGALLRVFPVNEASPVIVEAWLTVERALPMPV